MSALRGIAGSSVILLAFFVPAAYSQKTTHHGGGSEHHHGGGGVRIPFAVGGGYNFWPPYYAVGTPAGVITYAPPMMLMGPGGLGPVPVTIDRGPIAPPPPPGLVAPPPEKPPARPTRKDAARAEQLVLLGDRLFRNNNNKKAEERYLQAARLDPSSAAPLIRLAQIAVVREQFAEAAHRLREAETAQPGWIVDRAGRPGASTASPPSSPAAVPTRIHLQVASRRSRCLAGPRGPVVSLRPHRPRRGCLPSAR